LENLVTHRPVTGLEVVVGLSRHGRAVCINGQHTSNREVSGSRCMRKTVAWRGTTAARLSLQIFQEFQHRLSCLHLYSVGEPIRGRKEGRLKKALRQINEHDFGLRVGIRWQRQW